MCTTPDNNSLCYNSRQKPNVRMAVNLILKQMEKIIQTQAGKHKNSEHQSPCC